MATSPRRCQRVEAGRRAARGTAPAGSWARAERSRLIQEMKRRSRYGKPMSDHCLPYLANCSMLFTEEPLLRHPAAARAAGFTAVEFWWPFATPVPPDREMDAFVGAIQEAGVALVGLNFYAGDLAGPGCGVLLISRGNGPFCD